MSDLHDRQMRLGEIGVAGQLKMSRATVAVPRGPVGEAAHEYLSRAGVGLVFTADTAATMSFPHAGCFKSEECLQFAQGAWLATTKIREILGL